MKNKKIFTLLILIFTVLAVSNIIYKISKITDVDIQTNPTENKNSLWMINLMSNQSDYTEEYSLSKESWKFSILKLNY